MNMREAGTGGSPPARYLERFAAAASQRCHWPAAGHLPMNYLANASCRFSSRPVSGTARPVSIPTCFARRSTQS